MSLSQRAGILFVFAAAAGAQLSGQTWDTSGNNLLQGTYYFREVFWIVGDNTGSLNQAVATYGNISFDGNGNYSITNAQVNDSSAGAVQLFSATGTYSIAASGYGTLSNPLVAGASVYGLVSRGIFIGSSTESGYNDLFIAAPLASPAPTNASFQGSYTMMGVDFPSGVPTDTLDYQFQLNPDGNGNLGAVHATGYVGGAGSTPVSQNTPAGRYFFSNGGANVNFATPNATLFNGTKYLYLSADGSFVFGGSPTAWDMIVGVRSGGAAPSFNGLYYQVGVFQDESQLANGSADLQTYFGCEKPLSGVFLGHRRLLSVFNNNALGFSYSGSYTLNADATYDDSNYHYVFGAGGAIRIGLGNVPSIGINVAVQAPGFSGSGVFIDPTGILNAASSALFTAGIVPGEFLTIYGTNLAPDVRSDSTFPFTLDGVQVMINNRPAPIYFVSPSQVSAVVPFGTSERIAATQVINNGVASNTVTSFVNLTTPGVFTAPAGGLGYSAALHTVDYSVVTPSQPAHIGETIAVFLTGLGEVNPAVSDGAPGPGTPPFSVPTNTIAVFVDGQAATTSFTGLAPQLIGLYQINVTIPAGVHTGDVYLEVTGPDFDSREALISIAAGGAAIVTAAPRGITTN